MVFKMPLGSSALMARAPLKVMGQNICKYSAWHQILFALIEVSQTTKQISEEIFDPQKTGRISNNNLIFFWFDSLVT